MNIFEATKDFETGLRRLYEIVARLRAPNGCPWDSVQTLSTLRPCLIEEAYELLDVMATDDKAHHQEELGDVLLQIIFQAQLREQNGDFTLTDVINAISEKLIRRHPHVFSDVKVNGTADVFKNWEKIKKQEGAKPKSAIAGVPQNLPSTLRTQRIQSKTTRTGYTWEGQQDPLPQIQQLLQDLPTSTDKKTIIGSLLFNTINLARLHEIDAETALKDTTDAFATEFLKTEKL